MRGLTSLIIFLSWLPAVHAEWQFDFSGAILSGDINGYLQTPAGGQPDRSDVNRPTFDELDIHRMTSYEISAGVRKGRNRFFAGANLIREAKATHLQDDLLSQWQQFRAGDAVQSDVQLDWYRIGYLRSFDSDSDGLGYEIGGDVTLFSFHYQLNNRVLAVDRRYNKGGYRLGGRVNYDLTDHVELNLTVFIPLHGSASADITSVDLGGQYNLTSSAKVFAGVAFRKIDFEDGQLFPNHIRVEMDTMFRAGFLFSTH